MRVINGSDVIHLIKAVSAPTCVFCLAESHDFTNQCPKTQEVLYGTASGDVVQVSGMAAASHLMEAFFTDCQP